MTCACDFNRQIDNMHQVADRAGVPRGGATPHGIRLVYTAVERAALGLEMTRHSPDFDVMSRAAQRLNESRQRFEGLFS